eukprot:12816795-Alexandrium_andersonii.AAC.1
MWNYDENSEVCKSRFCTAIRSEYRTTKAKGKGKGGDKPKNKLAPPGAIAELVDAKRRVMGKGRGHQRGDGAEGEQAGEDEMQEQEAMDNTAKLGKLREMKDMAELLGDMHMSGEITKKIKAVEEAMAKEVQPAARKKYGQAVMHANQCQAAVQAARKKLQDAEERVRQLQDECE